MRQQQGPYHQQREAQDAPEGLCRYRRHFVIEQKPRSDFNHPRAGVAAETTDAQPPKPWESVPSRGDGAVIVAPRDTGRIFFWGGGEKLFAMMMIRA